MLMVTAGHRNRNGGRVAIYNYNNLSYKVTVIDSLIECIVVSLQLKLVFCIGPPKQQS